MIDQVNNNSSRPVKKAPAEEVKGFGPISALGCSFAIMAQAFGTMYAAMQKSGIEEAKISCGYNTNGIEISKTKQKLISKLRTEINAKEAEIAAISNGKKPTSKSHQAQIQADQKQIQVYQAQEGQMKSYCDSQVSTEQSFATDASNQFSGAQKGMNDLFDADKDGMNKILGTSMQFVQMFATQPN